jgi:hypothetical protein
MPCAVRKCVRGHGLKWDILLVFLKVLGCLLTYKDPEQ